jgi:hypothetical protein
VTDERRSYDVQLALMDQRLENHMAQEEADLQKIRNDIKELKMSVDDLVSAWRAAGNVATFVKWLAGIAAAVGILWSMFNGNLWK